MKRISEKIKGSTGWIVFILVLALGGFASAQTCVQPPAGLISWWAADGNAHDIWDGNHGTISGQVTFVTGVVGQAFNFGGAGFVQIPHDSSLEPVQITLDSWIRPVFSGRPSQPADTDTIIEKLSPGLLGYGLFVTMDPTFPFLQVPAGGVPLGTPAFFLNVGGIPNQIFSPVPLPDDGLYHHVAATYDGTTMRLFLDGVEVVNRLVAGSIVHVGTDVFIGGEPVFGPRPGKAAIDEVEIFSRALTAAEIAAIFNAGGAGKCKVTEASIDIKPGSFPNGINPRSKGKIPVAILTTDTFDATTVDPTTVLFGVTGTESAPVHAALEDVDGDGDIDMILHFNTQDTGIVCGDTSASVTGETFDGQPIEGSDSIKTVGCQ